ncbi:SUKH-3 domain-containing protein [Streptomyces xiamenensis]|uniref:SUKH-3 domain-containing protein n=1 Tax=Streptomyces xiamenensis TaxID=408015 RepID=UPI0035D5FF35
MPKEISPSDIDSWLIDNGWSTERDIGEKAERLIEEVAQESRRLGFEIQPFPTASQVIHSYGLLELRYPNRENSFLKMDPGFLYDGEAEEVAALAEGLKTRLFPIGYEPGEESTVLVAEDGRIFYLHFTGGYLAGDNLREAFAKRLKGGLLPDAEDFFVE